MNRRAFCVLAGALAPAFAWAQPVLNPRGIVELIYRISAGADGAYQGESAIMKSANRQRWFSRYLAAKWAAMEKEQKRSGGVILDFDPVTNSQDPSVKQLEISVEKQDGLNAIVAARFFAHDEKAPVVVRYYFKKEAGAWKIDDIAGEAGKDKWSLREILK